MIDVNQLRRGTAFLHGGEIFKVTEYSHNKPGRGKATAMELDANLRSLAMFAPNVAAVVLGTPEDFPLDSTRPPAGSGFGGPGLAAEGFGEQTEFVLGDVTASGLPDSTADFVWGEDGLPEARAFLVNQWQDGELKLVYPVGEFEGTVDLVYPKPAFE